jgi:hypothetical protein
MLSTSAVLGGCQAITTAIEHRNLDVQSKMTDTVFLEPVGPSKQTVFLQVRNTSDQADLDLASDLRSAIQSHGYTIVSEPSQAHYVLQVNVLQAGKADPSQLEQLYAAGWGNLNRAASVAGATAYGAGVGAMAGGLSGVGYGALIAAPVALVADAFVKNVTYSIVTDVQISERTVGAVSDRMSQNLKQGRSGTRQLASNESRNEKIYQTRIVSKAERVNLELAEAMPQVKAGVVRSIAGMF